MRALHPELLARVIVITAASDQTLQFFDARSVFKLLRKPFDIQELTDAARQCSALPPLTPSQTSAVA